MYMAEIQHRSQVTRDDQNSELTFEEHPGKRAQEKEVQQTGHDAADDSLIRLADPTNEQHLGNQQAHAEILVDRRSVRLQTESSGESREKIPSRRDCARVCVCRIDRRPRAAIYITFSPRNN